METVTDFIFLGCKITAHSACSHEIKRCLFLKDWYDKPRQHIKKERHHFAKKGPYKAMVFSVVMFGCESWTLKKSEH